MKRGIGAACSPQVVDLAMSSSFASPPAKTMTMISANIGVDAPAAAAVPAVSEARSFGGEEKELVVPPLQSLAAMTSEAVVKQSPKTPAPPIVDLVAEIMFLVKISSSISSSPSCSSPKETLLDAIKGAKSEFKLKINLTAEKVFEFAITLGQDDVILSSANGDDPLDAERRAFQRGVKRILNSDYCHFFGDKLSLYSTAADAPTGSFRYDLRCREKWVPSSRVPFCDGCFNRGHTRRFCFVTSFDAENEKTKKTKREVEETPSPPPASLSTRFGKDRSQLSAPPTLESSSERAFDHSNRIPVINTQTSLLNESRGSNFTQARQFDSRNVSEEARAPVNSSDGPNGTSALSHYERIVGSLNSAAAAAASSALQTVSRSITLPPVNNSAFSHPPVFEGRSLNHSLANNAAPSHPAPFEGRSSITPPNIEIPAHSRGPPNNALSSRPKGPFESCRPLAFEDTYTLNDPFYGCFHEGSEVKSNYDDSTVRAKILLLPGKLRTFKGIKQHVKELIKAAPKPKEYLISKQTIMAFLRCNFVNGLAVHVVKDFREGGKNFSLFIENICVGISSCVSFKAIPILTRDFLIRVMTMPLSIVDHKIKWNVDGNAASTSAVNAIGSSSPAVSTSVLSAKESPIRKPVLTVDEFLEDPKYSDELWYDRLIISDSPDAWSRGQPPVFKIDYELLLSKIISFIDILVIEKKTPQSAKQAALLLKVASEVGIEVIFAVQNGPSKVDCRLWFESACVEVSSFDSLKVQVNTVVHVLVNKFFQKMSLVMANWTGNCCRMEDHGAFYKFSFLPNAGNNRPVKQ